MAAKSGRTNPDAPDSPRPSRAIVLGGIAVIVVLAIVFVVLVARDDKTTAGASLDPLDGTDPGVVHVHGLGVDPKDGALYAATHTGVFRISEQGKATRVANRYQDTMGFTVAGPGKFLGSGHPDQREDLPDQLGLIESSNSGQTWQLRSLAGKADFHAIEYKHNTVYGYEASSARFMLSRDKKNWEGRAVMPIADFAVSPADGDVAVATTEDGPARSTDGLRTFTSLGGSPLLYLASWPVTGALFGSASDGTIYASTDGGETWQQAGQVDGEPEALTAVDARTVYVATRSGIYVSGDGGRTFERRLAID
jgi:hypothetical protein